jgi:hypothetical protein
MSGFGVNRGAGFDLGDDLHSLGFGASSSASSWMQRASGGRGSGKHRRRRPHLQPRLARAVFGQFQHRHERRHDHRSDRGTGHRADDIDDGRSFVRLLRVRAEGWWAGSGLPRPQGHLRTGRVWPRAKFLRYFCSAGGGFWPKAESTADGPGGRLPGRTCRRAGYAPEAIWESQQSRARMVPESVCLTHIAPERVDRLVPADIHHLEQRGAAGGG